MYKLSICIPTYNRKIYLLDLIDNLLNQVDGKLVQIVISDNCSTDGTQDELYARLSKFDFVKLDFLSQNYGADYNYQNVIKMADGEYCWFIGSDDQIVLTGVDDILSYLKSQSDIYLLDREECDVNLNPIRVRRWHKDNYQVPGLGFHSKSQLIEYFESSLKLGAVFSYLSSIVFKKSEWDFYPIPDSLNGTLYSHVYPLLSMVRDGCRLTKVTDQVVLSRGGNDSFLINWNKRGIIDLKGYKLLADIVFVDEDVKESFLSIMHKEHTLINVIKSLGSSGFSSWSEYKELSVKHFKASRLKFFIAEFVFPLSRFLYFLKCAFK